MAFFRQQPVPERYNFHVWAGDRYVSSTLGAWAGDLQPLMQMVEQLEPECLLPGFHVHVTTEDGLLVRSYVAEDFPHFRAAEQFAKAASLQN